MNLVITALAIAFLTIMIIRQIIEGSDKTFRRELKIRKRAKKKKDSVSKKEDYKESDYG